MTITRFLWAIVLLLGFTACYEKEEGCLDISATNFDVSADKPCPDDCCEYPVLRLNMLSQYSDIANDTAYNFTKNKLFEVPGMPGDSFSVSRLRYFISNVKLFRDGEAFRVADTIDLIFGTDKEPFIDDFSVLEPGSSSNVTLGTFPYTGEFDEIRFNFGLEGLVTGANPDSIPSSHPLSLSIDSTLWNINGGYQSAYIALFRDQVAEDSIPFQLTGTVELEFVSSEPIIITGGFDHQLNFAVDFYQWFTGVDPANDDIAAIKIKILANLSDSFLFLGYD